MSARKDPPPLVVLCDPIARGDIDALCDRVGHQLEGCGGPLICDVGGVLRPDAATIDALARLDLTARRLGRQFRLCAASDELVDLLALVGLDEFFPSADEGSGVEVVGQPEQREQALRVQEEADPVDPVA